jgi:hypothetical protein
MDSRGKGTKTRFDRAETLSIRNTFFAHDLIRKTVPSFSGSCASAAQSSRKRAANTRVPLGELGMLANMNPNR